MAARHHDRRAEIPRRPAIMLPWVARRSPAISTPPGNFSATIVVPCGKEDPADPEDPALEPIGSPLPPGSKCAACLRRKSEKEDESTGPEDPNAVEGGWVKDS